MAPKRKTKIVVDDVTGLRREVPVGEETPFRDETPGERIVAEHKAEQKARYGDRGVAAGTLGALQGVTAGGFIPLLRAVGGDADVIKGLIEHNQGIYTTAELGTALVTGVGGALTVVGKGGAIARGLSLTPSGLLSRGAATVNKLVGGGYRGAAIEAGIESGVFNAGQAVTSEVLTNPDLTAESVGAAMLKGAGIGLGVGVVGGVAAEGLGKLGSKILAKANAKSLDHLDNIAGALSKEVDNLDGILTRKADTFIDIGPSKGPRLYDVPDANAIFDASAEVASMGRAFKKAVNVDEGMPMNQAVKKIVKLEPKQAVAAARVFEDYVTQVGRVAKLKGANDAYSASVSAINKAVNEGAKKLGVDSGVRFTDLVVGAIEGLQIAETVTGTDIVPTGGPVTEALLKMYVIGRVLQGKSSIGNLLGGKAGLLPKVIKTAAGYAGRTAVREATPAGVSNVIRSAAGGVGGLAGREVAGRLVKGTLGALVDTQNKAFGQIAQSAGRFLKRGSILQNRAAKGKAIAALNAFIGDEERGYKEPNRSPQEIAARTIRRLQEVSSDPEKLEAKVNEAVGDLPLVSTSLSDMVKERLRQSLLFLNDKAPKDPGVLSTFGKSRWAPSKSQMSEFGRFAEAVMDPAGVFDDVASGRISPQAAEVIKKLYPEHFAEWQRNLVDNIEDLQKLPYNKQIYLGILGEVAINPMQSITGKLQQTYVSEEEARQQTQQNAMGASKLQSPAESLQEPTTAQQLKEKRF